MKFDTQQIIKDIEEKARQAKVSISYVCEKAGVARSTFDRWKRGEVSPSLSTLNLIYKVLEVKTDLTK